MSAIFKLNPIKLRNLASYLLNRVTLRKNATLRWMLL